MFGQSLIFAFLFCSFAKSYMLSFYLHVAISRKEIQDTLALLWLVDLYYHLFIPEMLLHTDKHLQNFLLHIKQNEVITF